MRILLNEGQIIDLFNDNLFEVVEEDKDYADIIFERKFSFGKKYTIGLCFDDSKIHTAINEIKDKKFVDKILLSGFNQYSKNTISDSLMKSPHLFGSRVEVLTKGVLFGLEKSAHWYVDYNSNLDKGDTVNGSFRKIIKNASDRITNLILENEENLWILEWREFEHLIASIFTELGYNTELTQSSNDGGKDVVCRIEKDKEIYFIELKLHKKKIGNKPVTKLSNLIKEKNDTNDGYTYHGLVIAPRGFPDNVSIVHEYSENMYIGNMKKVVSLCQRYVKRKSGLYLPNGSFLDVFKEDTKSFK